MSEKNKDLKNAIIIGIATILAYCACYIGRNILSAVMPQLAKEGLFDKKELGAMGSSFLLTYGFGQLINGFVGNKISPKIMVFTGLFVSGVIVFSFPFLSSFYLTIVFWAVCGFASSMLWGPISRKIISNTDYKYGKILMGGTTVASVLGMLVAYVFAFISVKTCKSDIAFYLSGIFMIVSSIVWLIMDKFMPNNELNIKHENQAKTATLKDFLKIGFISMIVVSMANGVIRNAVAFWIPTFVADNLGMPLESVAFISMVLPILNVTGTFISLWALKFVKNNERTMCVWLFLLSAILFLLVFLFNGKSAIITITSLFVASALMTGACNMIFGVYILHFKETGLVSSITGFIDFTSYITAAGASSLFPYILGVSNWGVVIITWIATCVIGFVFSLIAAKKEVM